MIQEESKKFGCLQCFCNGLKTNCESSNLYYNKINSNFDYENQDWSVKDKKTNRNLNVKNNENGISFDDFKKFDNDDVYISVPSKYINDKVILKHPLISIHFKDKICTAALSFQFFLLKNCNTITKIFIINYKYVFRNVIK